MIKILAVKIDLCVCVITHLTYIYITYIILIEIIIIFNCHGVTAIQLTTFVHFYIFNNNIALKMAAIVVETCLREYSE